MCIFLLERTLDYPNVVMLKNKCLPSITKKFSGFKTKLMSRSIFEPKRN